MNENNFNRMNNENNIEHNEQFSAQTPGAAGAAKNGIITYSLSEILSTVYKAKAPLIEEILMPGTYILAGAPKSGKSLLAEQIAYSVASGTNLWEFKTKKGRVLYFALEDTNPRIQKRYDRMYKNCSGLDELEFAITAKSIDEGLIGELESNIQDHPDTSLIIVDTFQKIRRTGNGYSYGKDYDDVSAIKNFADAHNLCVILVHHTRKSSAGEVSSEIFETISGTNGIMGSADGAIVLERANRSNREAILQFTGRDQSDLRLRIKLNPDNLIWEFVGFDSENEYKPKDSFLDAICGLVNRDNPFWRGTPTELAEILALDIKPNAVTKCLNVRAANLLELGLRYEHRRTSASREIILEYIGRPDEEE